MKRENGEYRILGGGLLTAPDEMEYALSDCSKKQEFNPKEHAKIQPDDTIKQESLKNHIIYVPSMLFTSDLIRCISFLSHKSRHMQY